jgi:DNA-binding response OmpR family regulator
MFSEIPVVFLTERGDEMDIIRGLEGGADDYIVKPFSALELLARARATLRRSGHRDGLEESTLPLVIGDLRIDFQSKEVALKDEPVHLTATEYQILYYLVRSPGKWVNPGSLEQWIWGQRGAVDSSVIRRYIHQLRRKLNDFPPRLIVNEPGRGYKFSITNSRLSTV